MRPERVLVGRRSPLGLTLLPGSGSWIMVCGDEASCAGTDSMPDGGPRAGMFIEGAGDHAFYKSVNGGRGRKSSHARPNESLTISAEC